MVMPDKNTSRPYKMEYVNGRKRRILMQTNCVRVATAVIFKDFQGFPSVWGGSLAPLANRTTQTQPQAKLVFFVRESAEQMMQPALI